MGLGDFAAATASDFWSHPKVTKRWPGDGQAGLGLRPPPPTALPPDPTTGAQQPCAKPKPQNLNGLTPPFCFAKFGGFMGDQQYSPPRSRHDMSLTLLTSVARRGRPVGDASESRYVQRGSAAKNHAAQFGNAGADIQRLSVFKFDPPRAEGLEGGAAKPENAPRT